MNEETNMFGGGGMGDALIIILLFIALIGGGGFGGLLGGGQAAAAVTAQDLQRAVDLNSIQEGQATIMNDVQRGIYEVNGTTKDAAYNNLAEIRDVQASIASGFANAAQCCCETQRAIDGVNYNGAINAANITSAIHAEGEATRALIQQDKIEALQAQVSQLQLQAAMCGVVRYPTASTYAAPNPFCGCGCGCA